MGNPATEHNKRRDLRKLLREAGLAAEAIEQLVQQPPEGRWVNAMKAAHASPQDDKLRKKLRARGYDPEAVEKVVHMKAVERRRLDQARDAPPSARSLAFRQRLEDETYRRLSPDDRRHRPTSPPSVETGPARAVGVAARAARRGRTVTAFQYQRAADGGR